MLRFVVYIVLILSLSFVAASLFGYRSSQKETAAAIYWQEADGLFTWYRSTITNLLYNELL